MTLATTATTSSSLQQHNNVVVKHSGSSTTTTMEDVPNEYICPISLEIMRNPVMDRSGRSFEKSAILEWLNRGNKHCPLTRQPLKPSSLIPNHSLKLSIDTWRRQHNFYDGSTSSGGDKLDKLDDDDEQYSFVGLVSCPPEALLAEAVARNANTTNHQSQFRSRHDHQQQPETNNNQDDNDDDSIIEDDLSDLLALYNEVLELTNAPLDSPLLTTRSNNNSSPTTSQQQQRQQEESSSPTSSLPRSSHNQPPTSSTMLFSINMEEPVNAAVQRSIDRRRRQEAQQMVEQQVVNQAAANNNNSNNNKRGKSRWPKVFSKSK